LVGWGGGGVVFWFLGLGVGAQTPNPQTPIPNPQSPLYLIRDVLINIKINYI